MLYKLLFKKCRKTIPFVRSEMSIDALCGHFLNYFNNEVIVNWFDDFMKKFIGL